MPDRGSLLEFVAPLYLPYVRHSARIPTNYYGIGCFAHKVVSVVLHERILLVIALEHIAVWTTQLERLKDFYVHHFNGVAGPRYENPSKDFASYFIAFAGGSRLEIMQMPSVPRSIDDIYRQFTGFIHIAFAPDSAGEIDQLTVTLETAGCAVLDRPHMTGDGYYESVILDPDGNRVELSYRPSGTSQKHEHL